MNTQEKENEEMFSTSGPHPHRPAAAPAQKSMPLLLQIVLFIVVVIVLLVVLGFLIIKLGYAPAVIFPS